MSKRTKHNALLDCELLREVYVNLLDVKEPKLNLAPNSPDRAIEKNEIYNDFYSNGNNFALEKLLGKKNSVIKI